MQNREFYITDDGIRLHAKLEFPEDMQESEYSEDTQKPRMPLMILLHGFTGHIEERHILAAADAARQAGYAVLRVDLYGHGGSDGEFRDHTLFKWIGNVLSVIAYAEKLPYIQDIILCGHSQGGLLTMLAGGLLRHRLRALILLSPAAMIPEGARSGALLGMNFNPDHIPETLPVPDKIPERTGVVLGANYVRTAQMIHVEDAIANYRGPVLIVHGDADETVPIEVGRQAAAGYADAQMVEIPGDTHCYDYHLEDAAEAIKKFLSL